MKFQYTILPLFLAATLTTACSNDTDEINEDYGSIENVPTTTLTGFAPDDGATDIRLKTSAAKLNLILKETGTSIANSLGQISINPEQYDEIKTFTDELVKDCKKEKDVYGKIFRWIYNTLEYKHEYEGGDFISNDPYPVFKSHVAICQGFSNLMHVMLHTQNIPALNVNGEYVGVGGHAWNYVYHSKNWWVCDATNNRTFRIYPTTSYSHLIPHSMDATIFENDDYACNFANDMINIDAIKSTNSQFVVPFSVLGMTVNSLCPTQPVPESVKEIFVSKNISTLGVYYRGLEKNAPSIEAIYVDPDNAFLEGFCNTIYQKGPNGTSTMPYYVPAALKSLELKPMKVLEKNTIFMHNSLESVVIPEGTMEICDYAFEKCPNLRVAYVPSETKIAENAFYGVHPDFQVVRGNYTGIPEIHM